MCKKIGIAAVAVLAGLLVLNNTRLGSWVGFAWKKAKDGICKQVPPEVEIERLRYELTQIDKEIDKNTKALAPDVVAVEELQKQVDNGTKNLKVRYAALMKAKKSVDDGDKLVSFNGRQLKPDAARQAIRAEWDSYVLFEKTLKSKEKLLESKERHLAQAKKALANWSQTRNELVAQIDAIEADLKEVRMAEAEENFQIDNTRLTRFQGSLDELKKSVRVKQEELKLHREFARSPEAQPAADKSGDVDRAWKDMEEREHQGEVV